MKKSIATLIAALAAAALWATPGYAQHDDKEGQHGKAAGKHEAPGTYAAAVAEIDERLAAIDGLIQGKKLDDVHREAQAIVDVAKTLAALALKADSGVPKDAVKEINKTAKKLAGKFDAIDKAGDAGDEAGTRKVYGEMVALQATLKTHAPAAAVAGGHAFACPMKCEGAKTYDAAGKCPKCGMKLEPMKAKK